MLSQLKAEKEIIVALINFCYKNQVPIILTPCNPQKFDITNADDLLSLSKIKYITANLSESLTLCKTDKIENCFDILPNLIATAGPKGVYYKNESGNIVNIKPLEPEQKVDTTGAGDTFCGNLIASLTQGHSLLTSIHRGICASTIKLEKPSAQLGMPYKQQVDKIYAENYYCHNI